MQEPPWRRRNLREDRRGDFGPALHDLRRRADGEHHELGRGAPGPAGSPAMTRRWCSASSSFDDYPAHSPYIGAIAGRYANRIAGGRFTIAGQHYQADKNFLGKHTLHGGAKSFGKRVWDVLLHGDDFVTFALHRPGWSDGLSRRARRHLHLPDEDTRHAVGRADRDVRRADALQPRASFLFQPRRWRQRRHSRPPADAGRRSLPAGRRGTDPDRRRPAGRRHGVRLPAGAADPPGSRKASRSSTITISALPPRAGR